MLSYQLCTVDNDGSISCLDSPVPLLTLGIMEGWLKLSVGEILVLLNHDLRHFDHPLGIPLPAWHPLAIQAWALAELREADEAQEWQEGAKSWKSPPFEIWYPRKPCESTSRLYVVDTQYNLL